MKKIKIEIHYYNYQWKNGKLMLNKRKLIRKKLTCSSISLAGEKRLSFEGKTYSTNIDTLQIKKLTIIQ